MDVAKLQVIIETKGVEAAQRELDKLSKQSSKTESATDSLSKSFGLLNIALSTVAVGSLIKETAQLADTYKLTEGRLSLVTKNTIELATAQQEILKISQKTRQSYADTIDLYTRVARSTQDLGKSQSDILKFTEIVNKSLVISGASAENSKAAIIQLGQALGSGVLQGDELRSILENAPRLAEAIAKGMSKTVSELKTLGEQGKLTAEEVFNAIQKQGDSINDEFGKMPKTIGQATTQMGNSILELVGTMDKLTGASGFVADKISSLSKIMDDFSSNARVASSSVFEQKTVDDITIKANQIANEIQSLQTKLKENDGALWFGLDDRTQSEYINKIKRLEQQMEQLGQTAIDVLFKTSEGTKSAVLSGEQVKKQVDDALSGYKAYYQAIGDNETVLSIKRREYAEKYKNLTAQQIDAIINSERDKNNKTEKLAEEWQKRKIEIATNIAIAEQDKLAEPFIKLEAKYKEDLEHFKGNKEAQIMLTNEYNAEVSRLQKDLTEKFNEEEKKKAEKAIEWQVKLFEANEKYNDEIIKMQDEMYGTDSSVEQWYNNQLEYLGKLSQEAGATSEELQTLLDKIETIRAMKLEKQTISFKVEQSFYKSFESNLTDSIEDAFNGDSLNLKKFFKNIQKSLTNTIASSMSGSIVNSLRGGTSLLGGLSSLAVGSSVSASEIANIMNSGGTFDSATNTITTSGGSKINVGSDGGGTVKSTGSDVMSLVNTISTLKTAYSVMTQGIGNYASGMFSGLAGGIDTGLGFVGLGGNVAGTSAMFINPATGTATSSALGSGVFVNPTTLTTQSTMASGGVAPAGASYGTVAAGSLVGGAVGYGVGSLGDKMFGAKTYAPTTGAIAGAGIGAYAATAGSLSAVPVVGWIAAAALLVLGGAIGKKVMKDSGLYFAETAFADNVTGTVQGYEDWQKKSWFSSKSWTNFKDLTDTQKKQIESMFNTYDYMLTQLGDADKIFIQAGKYSGSSFTEQLSKNFITLFTDIPQTIMQEVSKTYVDWSSDVGEMTTTAVMESVRNTKFDEIYQTWVDYAESIDKTVMEALSESVSNFVASKREYELWNLEYEGNSIDALKMKAVYLAKDFDMLQQSMGVSGVTIDNFLTMYEEAVKNSFDPQTLAQWDALGDALMGAADASKVYKDALSQERTITQAAAQAAAQEEAQAAAQVAQEAAQAAEELANRLEQLKDSIENTIESIVYRNATTAQQLEYVSAKFKANFTNEIPKTVSEWAALGEAMKGNQYITDDNIEAWQELGQVLAKVEDEALSAAQNLQTGLLSALDAVQGKINSLSNITLSFDQLSKIPVTVDNYNDLLSALDSSMQSQISATQDASNARIEQLEREKDLLSRLVEQIEDLYRSLTSRIVGESTALTLNRYYTELAKVKSGGSTDLSALTEESNSYLDKLYEQSTSKTDYLRGVAKIREDVMGLSKGSPIGTLTTIENAINAEKSLLSQNLKDIEDRALDILEVYKEQILLQIQNANANTDRLVAAYSQGVASIVSAQQAAASAAQQATAPAGGGGSVADKGPTVEELWGENNPYVAQGDYLPQNVDKVFKQAAEAGYDFSTKALMDLGLTFEQAATAMSNVSYAVGAGKANFTDLLDSTGKITQDTLKGVLNTALGGGLHIVAKEVTDATGKTTIRDTLVNQDGWTVGINPTLGSYDPSGSTTYMEWLLGFNGQESMNNVYSNGQSIYDLGQLTPNIDNTPKVSLNPYSNPTNTYDQWLSEMWEKVNGSHANGLDYVPFDGYIAELHKGERVQTASEVQKDSIINELQNSLKDLKDMFIKNIAETSRMSRVITRLDDNDALLVRVVV